MSKEDLQKRLIIADNELQHLDTRHWDERSAAITEPLRREMLEGLADLPDLALAYALLRDRPHTHPRLAAYTALQGSLTPCAGQTFLLVADQTTLPLRGSTHLREACIGVILPWEKIRFVRNAGVDWIVRRRNAGWHIGNEHAWFTVNPHIASEDRFDGYYGDHEHGVVFEPHDRTLMNDTRPSYVTYRLHVGYVATIQALKDIGAFERMRKFGKWKRILASAID